MNDVKDMAKSFIYTDRLHHKAIDKQLSALGVHRGSHFLLMMLDREKCALNQKEIALRLGTSPASVTVKLKKMEEQGLIKRNFADGRTNAVEITEKGKEIVLKSKKIFKKVDSKMTCGITEEMRENFITTLLIMQKNLSELL